MVGLIISLELLIHITLTTTQLKNPQLTRTRFVFAVLSQDTRLSVPIESTWTWSTLRTFDRVIALDVAEERGTMTIITLILAHSSYQTVKETHSENNIKKYTIIESPNVVPFD